MILEHLLRDKRVPDMLGQALSLLHQINMFGALSELSVHRSKSMPSEQPIENAALRAAWRDGYMEALMDLYYFKERYIDAPPDSKVGLDFGAAEALLKSGEITEEEYAKLKSERGEAGPRVP